MKQVSVKLLCFLFLGQGFLSLANAADSRYSGSEAIVNNQLWDSVIKGVTPVPPSASQVQIARVLSIAAKMQYVQDVMAVKESGLPYVTNLSDLGYLTSYTVENPSEAYKAATAEFITKHVATYMYSRADIPALLKLIGRVQTVDQAMTCKRAGLRVANTAGTFLRILPFGVASPSDEYRTQTSAFVAENIAFVVGPNSSIKVLIEIEKYTRYVTHAMAVKNAGLVAVRSKEDLIELAAITEESPSPLYQQEVRAFIRNNISRYP